MRRLLGRGGFAEVYVAFDKRLKREIAVKTIRGDLVVNEMLLERFQREAEAVAKLRHPNVVPIFSVGENRGIAYFTMPLIEGESLGAALEREGRFPLRESIRMLREASLALHAAHRAGIVHRDVKPDNIMLEGADRSVVVMDFGIAKSAGDDGKGLTGTGLLVGTPHYMSPEQAMGERTLDAPSDQYALATVGYRMLTGRAPFEGASVQTLLFKTVTEVPPPACEVAPDVPQELSDVLAKALSKRPEDRYESMAAFAAALAPFQHEPAENAGMLQGRRRVDLATRVRAMHAELPRLRPWILAAVPVLAAAMALFVIATPRVPLVVAGNRDEAIFAAKSFLKARGVEGERKEFAEFTTQDSVRRFLQEQLGFDGMQRRAMTDAPVWKWRIHSLSAGGGDRRCVWLGPGNRITGFCNVIPKATKRVTLSGEMKGSGNVTADSANGVTSSHVIPDSANGVTSSIESARSLAERELAALGWQRSQLARLPDSTISRSTGTDHVFQWRQPGGAVPWRGADSAYVRLSITVAGDSAVGFAHELRVPDNYPDSGGFGLFGWLSGVLITILAVVVLVRRAQTDHLQWGSMIRLSGFVAIGGLIAGLPFAYREAALLAGPGAFPFFIGQISTVIIPAGLGLFAVAGESLAYSRNPKAVAGLGDIARARLMIPEIVPAAAAGYLFGAIVSLLTGLAMFVTLRLGIGAPVLPNLQFMGIPVLDGLLDPLVHAIKTIFALLFAAAICFHIPRISRGALFVPAVIVGIGYAAGGAGAPRVLSEFAIVTLLTYALWQYGVLSAIVAVIVSHSVEMFAGLIRVGELRYLLGAAAVLAVMAAPAILAVLTLRRFPNADSGNQLIRNTN